LASGSCLLRTAELNFNAIIVNGSNAGWQLIAVGPDLCAARMPSVNRIDVPTRFAGSATRRGEVVLGAERDGV